MISAVFDSTINIVINFLNLGLFAFGLVKLLQAFLYIRKNRLELEDFKQAFQQLGDHPTKSDLESRISLEYYSEDGLIPKSISTLFRLSRTSMEDRDKIYYLEEVLNDQRMAFPKGIPGMAVIIGFLGTVLGLLIAVYELPETIRQDYSQSTALDNLFDSMGVAFEGMGTAFGTTLVGLSIALVLTFGNLLYQSRWNKLEHQLIDFLFLRLYPAFTIPAEENIVTLLVDAVDNTRSALEVIEQGNRKLIGSINTLTKNVEQYNQENTLLIERISTAVSAFIDSQKGNKEVFASIQQIAEQATGSFDRIQHLLDESVEDREAFLAYLQDSRDEIKEVSTLQHQNYEQTNQAFLNKQEEVYQQLGGDLRATNKNLIEEIEELNKKALKEFSKEAENKMEAFYGLSLQLKKDVETEGEAKLESFLQMAEQLKTEMKEVLIETQKTVLSQDKEAGKAFNERIDKLDQVFIRFKNEILENRKQDANETRRLIGELSALIQKNIEGNNFYLAEYNKE